MPYLIIRNKVVQEEYSIFPSEKRDSFSIVEKNEFENEWEVVGKPFGTEGEAVAAIRKKLENQLQDQPPQVPQKK